MLDALKEVIAYTHALGFLELVKVEGTKTTTTLNAMAQDRSVVLNSSFLQPVPELEGVFGLHDLGRLNTIVNCPEYKENAFVTISKSQINGIDTPVGISFANASRDFRNDYRFMSQDVVESQLPSKKRKDISWDIAIVPTVNAIQRLKFQSQCASSNEGTFSASVSKGSLMFAIGDHASHTGEFKFADVTGTLKTPRDWPLTQVQSILNLNGDKELSISDAGAMEIVVTTGLAVHSYTVLAQTK